MIVKRARIGNAGYNNFWQRGQKLRGVGQVCWALPGIAAPPLGSLLHYSTPCRMAPAEAVPYRGGGMLRGRWRHEGRSECPGPAFPPHLQPDVTTARGEGAGVGVATEMRDEEAASELPCESVHTRCDNLAPSGPVPKCASASGGCAPHGPVPPPPRPIGFEAASPASLHRPRSSTWVKLPEPERRPRGRPDFGGNLYPLEFIGEC